MGPGVADTEAVGATDDRPSAAPGELELLRRFVNTKDIEAGTDELATLEGAVAWLRSIGVRDVRTPRSADLDELVRLREALRDAVAHRGSPNGVRGIAAVNGIAEQHPIVLRFEPGRAPFASHAAGIDGVVERLLTIAAIATIDGTWDRLKTCANGGCRWVFYDHSRNRSRTWCSMDVCGARAKMRTYRARIRVDVPAEVPSGRRVPPDRGRG